MRKIVPLCTAAGGYLFGSVLLPILQQRYPEWFDNSWLLWVLLGVTAALFVPLLVQVAWWFFVRIRRHLGVGHPYMAWIVVIIGGALFGGVVACGGYYLYLKLEKHKLAAQATESSPVPTAPTPVTIKFKHTALVFHQRHGSVFVANSPVSIQVVYENTGDETAREVSANGVLRFIDSGDGLWGREDKAWKTFRAAWLSSIPGTLKTELEGHKTNSLSIETDPISAEQAAALRTGKQFVYFLGAIKWTDGTGQYETNICTYFRQDMHGTAEAPAIWFDGVSGHNVTRRAFQEIALVVPFSQRANIEIMGLSFPTPGRPFPSNPFSAGKPFFVNVAFRNSGPTPAIQIAAVARIAIADASSERKDQENIWEQVSLQAATLNEGANALMPNKESFFSVQYPLATFGEVPVSRSDIRKIKAGQKKVLIAVIFKYADAHGSRETHLCQCYQGESWRLWTDCYAHNEIVP
jgi:hypothetical protein